MFEKYKNLSIFHPGTFSFLFPGKDRLNLRSRDQKHGVFELWRVFSDSVKVRYFGVFLFLLLLCDFLLHYHR